MVLPGHQDTVPSNCSSTSNEPLDECPKVILSKATFEHDLKEVLLLIVRKMDNMDLKMDLIAKNLEDKMDRVLQKADELEKRTNETSRKTDELEKKSHELEKKLCDKVDYVLGLEKSS